MCFLESREIANLERHSAIALLNSLENDDQELVNPRGLPPFIQARDGRGGRARNQGFTVHSNMSGSNTTHQLQNLNTSTSGYGRPRVDFLDEELLYWLQKWFRNLMENNHLLKKVMKALTLNYSISPLCFRMGRTVLDRNDSFDNLVLGHGSLLGLEDIGTSQASYYYSLSLLLLQILSLKAIIFTLLVHLDSLSLTGEWLNRFMTIVFIVKAFMNLHVYFDRFHLHYISRYSTIAGSGRRSSVDQAQLSPVEFS